MGRVGGITAMRIKIDTERCKGCGLCVNVCPKHTLQMSESTNKSGYLYIEIIDGEECTGCGLCFQMCPDLVIEID